MAGTRGARSLRSERNEDPLQKLRRGLQDTDLAVLESLPPPDSYKFKSSQRSGYATIELCLGNRPRIDGTPCEAWASIVTAERQDLQPPVIFYDSWRKSSAPGLRSVWYSRSASSLLRKATDLRPPFCFFQHDPIDEVGNARNMLCAIVLYQALVTGVDTCALHWEKFGDSLSQALQYIHSRDAYQQWQRNSAPAATGHTQLDDISSAMEQDGHGVVDVQNDEPEDEPRTAVTSSDKDFTGGSVRPERGVVARPNTSLARLKDELGSRKSKLLDQMPALPMLIEPHNLGQFYFPFRMLIGSHTWQTGVPFKVYAYLEHDRTKNASMRFLGHDRTGHEQRFTMDELRGITLLQPLEHLNTLEKPGYADGGGSSARTAKIRSVISYYFFLAENEGWIGDPCVKIGEGFGKRLCAAIAEMQSAGFGEDDSNISDSTIKNREDETNTDILISKPHPTAFNTTAVETELTREEESRGRPSRILKLNIQPKILHAITKKRPSMQEAQRTIRRTQNNRDEINPGEATRESRLDEGASNLQLRMRSSRRHPQEVAHELAAARKDENDWHRVSVHDYAEEASNDHNSVVECVSTGAPDENSMPSNIAIARIDPVNAKILAEKEKFEERINIVTPELKQDHGESAGADATTQMSSAERLARALPAVVVGKSTHSDDMSMDIFTPSTEKSFPHAQSPPETRSINAAIAQDLLTNSQSANVRVAQILDNRPPTPAGSAERELKPLAFSPNVQDMLRVEPIVIDLCSDDEDINIQLRTPGTASGQIPETKNNFVHSTPSFDRPRGKKRKLSGVIHLSDNEDEAIEETDGNAHRQARLRRRK